MKKTIHKQYPLFWRITITLLIVLVMVGLGYIFISSYAAQRYLQEANQQLYGDVATHLVSETQPIVNGQVDTAATHDIMHSMMVINRSVEVYILDPTGKIIDYVVPFTSVKLDQVNIKPVQQFIETKGEKFITGDDPKEIGTQKVFSAAPIFEQNQLAGYAYIILASEEQMTILNSIFGSYFLKNGALYFFAALIVAFLTALVAIFYITRNLNVIIESAQRFRDGDYAIRIPPDTDSSLSILREAFNDMANTIQANILELKSMDRLRQELIANVSHDLRTPLSITKGYLETLQIKEGQLSDNERKQYLKIAFDSSERLGHLVDQLFEYSKLEARQIEPQKEPFPLSELLQDVSARYQLLAQEKDIPIQLHISKELPLVFADIGLVERAIQNLLDNAIKFTPRGGVINIELNNQPEGVEVRITDTGPGIPEEEQTQIFERYQRAARNGQPKNNGAGLGLAIVKKIIEIHDASIKVQNRPDKGTVFWFHLPTYQG